LQDQQKGEINEIRNRGLRGLLHGCIAADRSETKCHGSVQPSGRRIRLSFTKIMAKCSKLRIYRKLINEINELKKRIYPN
jgi:hypothetical protein